MIIQQNETETKTSGDFENTTMNISPEAVNKMIWHTILQYKYKIRTSVQELISNAIDAQVEAGNPDTPLKIQLPTRLEPTFKLRDFGTGMTPDVINNIYKNMGASGSSHTNTKKGGFGIGGKSPLGFTEQYKIRTIVDGTEWTYIVHGVRGESINIKMLHKQDTSEPNGTEIQVPAKPEEIGEFKRAACRATMFWKVQPEFNLPEEERYTADNGRVLSDTTAIYTKQNAANMFGNSAYNSTVLVLIDGIPYELDGSMVRACKTLNDARTYLTSDSLLVLSVGIGDVKPLQTRESLEECEKTSEGLDKAAIIALADIKKDIKSLTDKSTLREAVECFQDVAGTYRTSGIKVELDKLIINSSSVSWKLPSEGKAESLSLVRYTYRSKRGRWYGKNEKARKEVEHVTYLDTDELNIIYLDDTDESDIMKSRRLKFETEDSKADIMMLKLDDASPELRGLILKHFNFKPLSSLPLPPKKAKTSVKRAKKVLGTGKIDVHVLSGHGYDLTRATKTIDLASNTTKFIYDDYSDYDSKMVRGSWVRFMKRRGYNACLVAKKYRNDVEANKNFIALSEWLKGLELTPRETQIILDNECYQGRDTGRIAKLIKKSGDKRLTQLANYVTIYSVRGDFPASLTAKVLEDNKELIKERNLKTNLFIRLALKKYPLLGALPSYKLGDEVLTYINALNRR